MGYLELFQTTNYWSKVFCNVLHLRKNNKVSILPTKLVSWHLVSSNLVWYHASRWACLVGTMPLPWTSSRSLACLAAHGFPYLRIHSGPCPRVFSDCHSPQLCAISVPCFFPVADFFFSSFIFPASAGAFRVGANKAWLFFIFLRWVSQIEVWHFLIPDSPLFSMLFPAGWVAEGGCWLDVCDCMLSHFSCVWLFATLWTIAFQAPLSMEFSRQVHWNGLPCSSPGIFPTQWSNLRVS